MKRFLLPSAWWQTVKNDELTKWSLDHVVRRTINGYPTAATEWLRRIEDGEHAAKMALDETVSRAAREDVQAQGTLFSLYSDKAVEWARSRVPNIDNACDVVQGAFIIAFGALPGLEQTGSFGAWLYRIIERQAMSHMRERLRRRETQQNVAPSEVGAWELTPPDAVEASETVERWWRRLRRLPRKKRAVATLLLAGLSYNEIAGLLGVSVGTVSSMVYRLRSEISGYHDYESDPVRQRSASQ